jgi:death-on-curing protein
MKYLSVDQVLRIHAYQVARFGGSPGVRSTDLLESAVAQPGATFSGEDLYPTLAEKAAALGFALVQNHPFEDGNKRTGHAAMVMFLSRNGHTIKAPLDEQADVFERVAGKGMRLKQEGLLAWVRARIARK